MASEDTAHELHHAASFSGDRGCSLRKRLRRASQKARDKRADTRRASTTAATPAVRRVLDPSLTPIQDETPAAAVAAVGPVAAGHTSHKVVVGVRCRPIQPKEEADPHDYAAWRCHDDEIWQVNKDGRRGGFEQSYGSSLSHRFDHVWGPGATNADVYKDVAAPLVDALLDSYNITIFAYGQTNAGKTHTMRGQASYGTVQKERPLDGDAMGVIPRCVRDVFAHIDAKPNTEFVARIRHVGMLQASILTPPSFFCVRSRSLVQRVGPNISRILPLPPVLYQLPRNLQ